MSDSKICGICYKYSSSDSNIKLPSSNIWSTGHFDRLICSNCVDNIINLSEGRKDEVKSFLEWKKKSLTADDYLNMIKTWYGNDKDKLLLVVMQWISANTTNTQNNDLVDCLWGNSKKPEPPPCIKNRNEEEEEETPRRRKRKNKK